MILYCIFVWDFVCFCFWMANGREKWGKMGVKAGKMRKITKK